MDCATKTQVVAQAFNMVDMATQGLETTQITIKTPAQMTIKMLMTMKVIATTLVRKNWVRNISKTPLTEAQEHVLAHGPNFVVVPREPPICDYIVATEKAFFKTDARQGRRTKRRNQGYPEEETKLQTNYFQRRVPGTQTNKER